MVALALLALASGCDGRPPITPPDDEPPEGERPPPGTIGGGILDLDDDGEADHMGPIRVDLMRKDTAALGSNWYAYDPSTHVLTPHPRLIVLRDVDDASGRAASVRIVSYYDESSGESGIFTLALSTFDDGAWGEEETFVASRNIKSTGPVCLDVFTREERDCDDAAWHLALRIEQYMSPGSGMVVANPGLFPRSHVGRASAGNVQLAVVEGVTRPSDLPPPSEIAILDDVPHDERWLTDVAPEELKRSRPARGALLGSRFVDDGFVGREDAWFLVNGRQTMARFRIAPVVAGDRSKGLTVTFATAPLIVDEAEGPPIVALDALATRTVDVALPDVGAPRFLSFENEDLSPAPPLLEPDTMETARWPHRPPNGRAYDLVIERGSDDVVRVWLSPAAVALEMVREYARLGFDPAPLDEMVAPHDVTDPEN